MNCGEGTWAGRERAEEYLSGPRLCFDLFGPQGQLWLTFETWAELELHWNVNIVPHHKGRRLRRLAATLLPPPEPV